ncbi:MAG: AAA family ATPase [Deltaproteobacteria bacterium]|nr:AAA family ATPase [Deltaproteobacteria bacterium]
MLVNLNMMGSGYEMIFSLIYSFYLSKQSGKQLIAFIDEPELHLHPSLQGDFVKFLLEISKESQIILTSQSPLFIKQLSYNKGVCIYIFQKNNGKPELVTMDERVLPYVSANEINYLAFGLPTAEFHNELYGFIQTKAIDEDENNAKELNFDGWLSTKGLQKNKDWVREVRGTAKPVEKKTAQTYIRNSIHHPENTHNKIYSDEELKNSIEKMIQLLRNL